MSKIYNTPLSYKLLHIHGVFVFKHWFSSVEINGEENIPNNASVIFAPNHQNAFTDAMAVLAATPGPVVFLARADIFAKSLVDKILRFLKIMPAYRMRNGISNLKKNADSFEQAAQVLEHKQFFCLMPEGGQEEVRKLRPLVKGMFRIGFSVQDHYKDTKDNVYIVPTGIDYSDYDHSGGHLIVSFDKPLNMRNYYDKYVENAPVAQNDIRKDLFRKMSTVMLNIRTDEHYDTIYTCCYIYNLDKLSDMGWDDNETNRLVARQNIAGDLDEICASGLYNNEINELDELTTEWRKHNHTIEEAAIAKEYGRSFDAQLLSALIYAICMSPLAIYSALVNWPVFALVKSVCEWKLKDTGFYSTIALAANMVFYPIWHLLLAIIGGIFITSHFSGLQALLFAITLPISYFFAYKYWWNLKYIGQRFKNIFSKEKLTDTIADKLTDLFKRYKKDKEEGRINVNLNSGNADEDNTDND